ncbi:MAG: hypothetical protein Q8P22_04305 [Chloroflexota bacterium]|nr:hypothetical protein [Chloroflexota bacterium]
MQRLAFVLSVPFLVLLLVACNGGGEEKTSATGTAATTPSATAITEESIKRVSVPANVGKFEQEVLAKASIREKLCIFLQTESVVDCGGDGVYMLTTPVEGTSARCNLLSDESKPLAISCTTQDPEQRILYAIK